MTIGRTDREVCLLAFGMLGKQKDFHLEFDDHGELLPRGVLEQNMLVVNVCLGLGVCETVHARTQESAIKV